MGNLLVCENYRGILFTLLTMHSYPDRLMCVGRNLLILLCLPFEGERRLVNVVPIDYKIPAINQDIHDSWRFLINSRAKAYTLSLFTLRFTFIPMPRISGEMRVCFHWVFHASQNDIILVEASDFQDNSQYQIHISWTCFTDFSIDFV